MNNKQEQNLFLNDDISFFNINHIHLPWYELIKKFKSPIELVSIFEKNIHGMDDETIEQFKSISNFIPENSQFLIVLKEKIKQLPTPNLKEQNNINNINNYVVTYLAMNDEASTFR
jgi:hypothetical protein